MIFNKCKHFFKPAITPVIKMRKTVVIFIFCFFSPVILASPYNVVHPRMPDTVSIEELGALNLVSYIMNEYKSERWDVEKDGPPPRVVAFNESDIFQIIPIVEKKDFIALHYISKSGYSSDGDSDADDEFNNRFDLIRLATYIYQKDGPKWVLMNTFYSLLEPSELIAGSDTFSFSSYFPLTGSSQAMTALRK